MAIGLRVLLLVWSSLCCCISSSVGSSSIPLDSKISVDHPSHWLAPKGDFAFGFFSHPHFPSQLIAGVRFNSPRIPPPDRPVVWVAGGGVSVGNRSSYFHLAKNGDMLLYDGIRHAIAWSSNTGNLSVVSAALLDDGNLVLFDANGTMVWQSFLTPFDTLLPGQNLTSSQLLRATSSNSVSSYYSLQFNASTQLVLTWESHVCYWKSDAAMSSSPALALAFTTMGALELLDQRSMAVWSRFADDHGDSSVHFRYLRLDVDGNLRMYSWLDSSKSWKVVWQAVQNQCDVFATCGLRGVCVLSAAGLADCVCPFSLKSNSSLNCLMPYKHNCSSGMTMMTLANTFLYGIYPPHDVPVDVGAEDCRMLCFKDPLCTSASTSNDGNGHCWLKRTRYVTGSQHSSLSSISFVKECLDPLAVVPYNLSSPTPSTSPTQPGNSHIIWHPYYFVGAVLGTVLAIVLVQTIAGFCITRRRVKENPKGIGTLMLNSIGIVSLSYADVEKLTDGFREPLGPKVHKGVLPGNQIIVVKDLKDLTHVEEKHFRCWISVLGSIYHKNLVKLVAYCYSAEHRFVVYPFMKNGSVHKWLEEAKLAKKLNWPRRMDICLGVAGAISYLHSGCRHFISHGNLHWKNVLLDEQFEPKLTEFGFSKFFDCASIPSGSAEEDVARFGEMLIMMVTGNPASPEVCSHAYNEWAACHVDTLIDLRMAGKTEFADVERMLRVAFWCVQDNARLRPSMSEVTKVLEGTLPVDPPPPPYNMLDSTTETTLEIEELC